MFSELLNHFFGQHDPSESIKQDLNQHWADWLQPITLDNPTGEDLTYHDSFQEIKEEIGKLSEIDYKMIAAESEIILKQSSKDIRVATYYCLARLHIDGIEGFADGIELLASLLDKFGSDIYPSRQNIRKNAIEWLTNAKFIDELTQLQPITEINLIRIVVALNLIDVKCQTLFSSDDPNQAIATPDLTVFANFLTNIIKQPIKTNQADEKQPAPAPTPLSETSTLNEVKKITSQQDLLDQARKMASFLREKPEGYFVAGRFLRVIRWDTIIELPPADHRGRTRLPAPRAELKQHISRLMIQQQWTELFERVETAFMESANHFWLDLQRASVIALQKMGEPYQSWADIYLTDIGLMLERLKGVERLFFENGTPFADDETRAWITKYAHIQHIDEGENIAPIVVSGENDWNEIEKQALELAHNENLEKAFQWLQHLPSLHSTKQRYLLQYTQARIAEQLGKHDIALKLLMGLNERQQSMTLLQWEPELLFDIKRYLLRLIKQKNQFKDEMNPNLFKQIEQLQHELMQLDPARAVSVM